MDSRDTFLYILVAFLIVVVVVCASSKNKREGWIAGEDAILEPCYTQCMAAAKDNYPVWLSGPANYSNYVTDPICRQKCCKRCNNYP